MPDCDIYLTRFIPTGKTDNRYRYSYRYSRFDGSPKQVLNLSVVNYFKYQTILVICSQDVDNKLEAIFVNMFAVRIGEIKYYKKAILELKITFYNLGIYIWEFTVLEFNT